MYKTFTAGLFLALLGFTGCPKDGEGGGDGNGKVDSACSVASDCGDGLVCLAYGSSPGVCTPTCSVSADECSGEATCAGSGLVVDVCQPEDKVPDESEPPAEEEAPRLPCASDDECAEMAPNAICMEYQGYKDCTIPCNVEQDCDLPTMMGVTMDYLTCTEDEGNSARSGCVLDEACFANPMACMSFDF